uniref:Uncharacterized protein n=1 Tax=Callithrix jacchus TaxID=9483 RepID=A0A5F4VW63_CALJA
MTSPCGSVRQLPGTSIHAPAERKPGSCARKRQEKFLRTLGRPSTAPPRSAAQRRAQCVCEGARTAALGAWSSGTRALGAPCATTPGTWRMRRWCAASWAVVPPSPPWGPPPLALAPGRCGWTRWAAGAARGPCGTALRSGGDAETVRTRRMRACAAWVSGDGGKWVMGQAEGTGMGSQP